MASLDRVQVRQELLAAPAQYRHLLDTATADRPRQRTNGTRWTNQEMLFHLLLGYLVVRTLRPILWVVTRLPPAGRRGFAAVLNAGTRPFHVVNYLGCRMNRLDVYHYPRRHFENHRRQLTLVQPGQPTAT